MRILSSALIREKNQLNSDHVLTMCFELSIQGIGPYRLVNYDQNILFHGLTFERYPVDVDALEDATSVALVRLRVTIGNVDRALQGLLENYWHPDIAWTVIIWQIDAMQPNETPYASGEQFNVVQVATDLVSAIVDLQAEGLTLTATVPKRRYTATSGFQSIPRRIG